jgi:hypothetical protein
MGKILTASAAGLALAGTLVAAASPADAQRWRGGRGGYHGRYHGGRTGVAIGAGILGLAAGAAIASNRGYYGGGGYGYAPGYYRSGYGYAPGYYGGYGYAPGYYAGPYCRSGWRWDGWARAYVRVRYCD